MKDSLWGAAFEVRIPVYARPIYEQEYLSIVMYVQVLFLDRLFVAVLQPALTTDQKPCDI